MIQIYKGDCLIESDRIESGSFDLILTDLPYGNMNTDGGRKLGIDGWDNIIPTDKIMQIANRILRKNGRMVLFAQQPFTTELINGAIPNLQHCYNMIWQKDDFANCLGVNKAPVNYYEDILVFGKKHDQEGLHPLRSYFKSVLDFIGLKLGQINKILGHRRAEHTFYVTPKKAILGEIGGKADHVTRMGSTQFSLCTEKTYLELIDVFGVNEMKGFKDFESLKEIDNAFKSTFKSTFNLWEGNKYKSNILKYKKDYDGYHPTQKPVLLLEDLIKTFSNEGDIVADLTMDSGSTGVACVNTSRSFIGVEKGETHFNTAKKRIDEAQENLKLKYF